METVQEFEQALDSLDAPLPEQAPPAAAEPEIADVSFAEAAEPEPEKAVTEEVRHVRVGSNIDILAELEKLRKTSTATGSAVDEKPRRPAAGLSVDDLLATSLNHRKEVSKVFEVQVPRRQLAQGHHVTVGLRFEDNQGKEIGEGQSFAIELQSRSDIAEASPLAQVPHPRQVTPRRTRAVIPRHVSAEGSLTFSRQAPEAGQRHDPVTQRHCPP